MKPFYHLFLLVCLGEKKVQDTLVVMFCFHSTIRGSKRAHILSVWVQEGEAELAQASDQTHQRGRMSATEEL